MKYLAILCVLLLTSCDNSGSPSSVSGGGLVNSMASGMAAGVGAGIGHAVVGHAINKWHSRRSSGGFNRMSRGRR